ncbi:MAG: NADH-quinone oxidoreductase subunit J, partial [Aggregatilineales bacterium]
VYAGSSLLAGNLAFQSTSDYQSLPAGTYKVEAFAAHTDGSPIDLTKDQPVLAASVTVPADSTVTLVASQDKFIAAPEDVSPVADDAQFRYVAINALPGSNVANLLQINPTDVKNSQVAAAHLGYGDASQPIALPGGPYTLAWEVNGQRVASYPAQTINADTEQVLILAPDANVQGAAIAIQISQRTQPSFGSPQQVGEQLFGPYLLPFELVSLLLLAAMVGAIVLTREDVIRRERKRLVVTPQIARLNQPADQLTIGQPLTAANPAIANPANAETRHETASD